MRNKSWEEEEEKLKNPRKSKTQRKKMRVSGKSVFLLKKELKKKK